MATGVGNERTSSAGLYVDGGAATPHSLWVLLPAIAGPVAWVWAAVVLVSGAHRIVAGHRALRESSPALRES